MGSVARPSGETTDKSSEQNEKVIRDYFENRSGWKVTKLDMGKEPAADFRIGHGDESFLCEVKTIQSVRANVPYSPVEDYMIEQRNKRKAKMEEFRKADPHTQLVMTRTEYEFLYCDESELRGEYKSRTRNTEPYFWRFTEMMQDYFKDSGVNTLPYTLRLDSDDLWVPQDSESFFKWVEDEIRSIHTGKAGRYWTRAFQGSDRFSGYSASYPPYGTEVEGQPKSRLHLLVQGPFETGNLELEFHCYGVLNVDSITRNVESGLRQLNKSAKREIDQTVARIIALFFAKGLAHDDWDQLHDHIVWLLKHNDALSAIAVAYWVPEQKPPPETEDNILAHITFLARTPRVVSFIVYHNPWLRDVKPLEVYVFDDKRSLQFSPLKSV